MSRKFGFIFKSKMWFQEVGKKGLRFHSVPKLKSGSPFLASLGLQVKFPWFARIPTLKSLSPSLVPLCLHGWLLPRQLPA